VLWIPALGSRDGGLEAAGWGVTTGAESPVEAGIGVTGMGVKREDAATALGLVLSGAGVRAGGRLAPLWRSEP
jgi:hypothetical protein